MFGSFLPSLWSSSNQSLLGSREPTLLCNQVGVLERVARGQQLIHNFKLPFIPHFLIEAANDGPVLHGHWDSPPPDALIRYLRRSALPYGTALRKPVMARLHKAYSRGVRLAILIDGCACSCFVAASLPRHPCSAGRSPRSP